MPDAMPRPSLAQLLPSFMLTLAERDLSPRTLKVYERTGSQFTKWLADNDLPCDREGIDAPHIRAFLAAETRRTSAVSANRHYRKLRVLFKWLIEDGRAPRRGPHASGRAAQGDCEAQGRADR